MADTKLDRYLAESKKEEDWEKEVLEKAHSESNSPTGRAAWTLLFVGTGLWLGVTFLGSFPPGVLVFVAVLAFILNVRR